MSIENEEGICELLENLVQDLITFCQENGEVPKVFFESLKQASKACGWETTSLITSKGLRFFHD